MVQLPRFIVCRRARPTLSRNSSLLTLTASCQSPRYPIAPGFGFFSPKNDLPLPAASSRNCARTHRRDQPDDAAVLRRQPVMRCRRAVAEVVGIGDPASERQHITFPKGLRPHLRWDQQIPAPACVLQPAFPAQRANHVVGRSSDCSNDGSVIREHDRHAVADDHPHHHGASDADDGDALVARKVSKMEMVANRPPARRDRRKASRSLAACARPGTRRRPGHRQGDRPGDRSSWSRLYPSSRRRWKFLPPFAVLLARHGFSRRIECLRRTPGTSS